MAYEKHIIQRQLIELEMSKGIDQLAVQNQVSSIYRQQIMPLLDELLSQVSGSSAISIDHLELNIGSISVNELEQVLASRIMIALQEKLDQVIVTANTELPSIPEAVVPQQQQSHTDAELLSHFLQTGLFPWWAPETTYAYLETILKVVLRRKDVGFKNALTTLLQSEDTVKRLIYTFSDALLEQLVEVYTVIDSRELFRQKETLFAVFASRIHVQQLRNSWWTAVLQIVRDFADYPEKELLKKPGWQFVKVAAQQARWSQLLQWHNKNAGKSEVLESITEFIRLDNETRATETQQESDTSKKNPDEKKGIESKEEPTPDAASSTPKSVDSDLAKDDSIQLPKELLNQDIEDPVRRLELSEGETAVAKNIQPQPVSDIDKIYIENAGLVLLWPFLHRFFQQLELADDKTFLSKENAERACLLLQYLATDSIEMFEAQLLLNKMLCGIPLLQPIDTQWTITNKEKAESENLLLAVIENAGTVWKNLSVNGLRQAYLQRDGILSSRDGAWLLQIERKPYDILIERLPWTVSIVKLPWMKGLVFVEW